ncbi:MAG: methyltransferase domain-containing protein [Fibrobacteres bacterium]|nr:methyltransferase domain-containing protein [Fibrobacterota bacterium]
MNAKGSDVAAHVRAQYEAFPYPAYGLFLPLRGQEAYASNSLFAARVLEQRGLEPSLRRAPAPAVLLAGCGDVFPYLSTFWEPRRHGLIAMDLSARSLRRARLRCLPRMRAMEWLRADLGDEDIPLPEGLAHVDCYGVLHHMARPAAALGRIARLLAPGGTARIMVYNSEARTWIRHLQRAFALLGLEGTEPGDREPARSLLQALAEVSPALRARLAPMHDVLSHPARLVDTFFHAREARLGAAYWLRALADAGLAPIGLYDRYGELDDLPNPLLEVPTAAALGARIADRRFENNLELYLAKIGPAGEAIGNAGPGGGAENSRRPFPVHLPSALALRNPPASWWGYRETRKLPWYRRRSIWMHFLANLRGRPSRADAWAARMPPRALQRLGRLGAIWPDECASAELKALLRSPLEASMEPPEFPAALEIRGNRGLRDRVEGLLRGRAVPKGREEGRPTGTEGRMEPGATQAERRMEQVMSRLDAAQRP